jgi:inner membrane protein
MYASWVFGSRKHGVLALVVFTFVYALIYVLMRLEDEALLIGALASFAAIACVMYFTRGIDWYGSMAGSTLTREQGGTILPSGEGN